MKVTKISAITLSVSDMKKSVEFYSKIPNFNLVYGCSDSQFTSFLIDDMSKSYLSNLPHPIMQDIAIAAVQIVWLKE